MGVRCVVLSGLVTRSYDAVKLSVLMSRNSRFYVKTILLPLMIICYLDFLVFFIDVEDLVCHPTNIRTRSTNILTRFTNIRTRSGC
jgi:hypothetical protein